jgi:hypothetical protein
MFYNIPMLPKKPPRRSKRPLGRTRRRVGAQPGNQNQLKHGFYASHFQPDPDEWKRAERAQGLDEEIKMLRLLMHKTFCLAGQVDDPAAQARISAAIGMAGSRIGRLLLINEGLKKSQKQIEQEEAADIIIEWYRGGGRAK